MAQIRRSILYQAIGNKEAICTLGFLLFLKIHAGCHSTIKDFSINKIAAITHCSWSTCKKYLQYLTEHGLLIYDPKNNSLTIRRLSSGTKHRNIRYDGLCFKTFKDAKYSVAHLLHMLDLSKRVWIKDLIRVKYNPKKWPSKRAIDDKKAADKLCKIYLDPDPITGLYVYNDYGIAYTTIAKKLGCCKKTAVKIIKEGVKRHLFKKKTHAVWIKLPYGYENFDEETLRNILQGATYVSRNGYALFISANTYELSSEWKHILCANLHDKTQKAMTEEEYQLYMTRKEEQEQRQRKRYKKNILHLSEMFNVSVSYLYSLHMSINKLYQYLRSGAGHYALATY